MMKLPLSFFVWWVSSAVVLAVSFNEDIRLILADRCFACHGPDSASRKADLRLDREDTAKAALGESGSAPIVPGKPETSAILHRMTSSDPDEIMPPPESKMTVSSEEIQLIRQWINEGAKWERHWAFNPPKRSNLPTIKEITWPRHEMDHFIVAQLEAEGLKPTPPAEAAQWLRRVSFDLTGLPPSINDLDAFLADSSEDAYANAVERLLGSPAFGERLALEWLDVARYGDTDGLFEDHPRSIYPWRDWLVSAFNENLPYSDFISWQLAGDLFPNASLEQKIATGFLRNNPTSNEGGIIDEDYRIKYLVDRVNTTSTAFLGITMECAQCHDHKFDPMSQREYYAFGGFFNSLVGVGNTKGATAPTLRMLEPEQELRLAEVVEELAAVGAVMKETPPDMLTAFEKWVAELDPEKVAQDKIPEGREKRLEHFRGVWLGFADGRAVRDLLTEEKASIDAITVVTMIAGDEEKARDNHILMRGEYDKPGEKVAPSAPSSIMPYAADLPKNRLGLAQWIVSPDNPLTARVVVNRYWQMIFGTGIVATSEDFGTQGSRPSHAALLDHLTVDFVNSGWDVKRLLRLLVTSATYRQSSRQSTTMAERDPGNRWLSRASRQRLAAEFVRDHALSISGLLVGRQGGPGVHPYQPSELFGRDAIGAANSSFTQGAGENLYRRSLYTYWKRQIPAANMRILGADGRTACRTRREKTNTPLQALVLLNDPQFVGAARALAVRSMDQGGATPEDRIGFAFRSATSRKATPAELSILLEEYHDRLREFEVDLESAEKYLKVGGEYEGNASGTSAELAAYAAVASLIINLDESMTKS